MSSKTIAMLTLIISLATTGSCTSGSSSSGSVDVATASPDATPDGELSAEDVSSDGSLTMKPLCLSGTDGIFEPSEPVVPEWFETSNGYRRRLTVRDFAVCAVASFGAVECWGDEGITGVGPILKNELNWPLVVRVVTMPVRNIVDISLQGFWGLPFALVIDHDGNSWGWSYRHTDFFPPPLEGRPEEPSVTPIPIDLGGKVLQGVSGTVDGGYSPSIIARVDPGIIHGLSNFWVFLGKPERWDPDWTSPAPESAYPLVVPGVADFVQVQSGYGYFCGLQRDRNVTCWGGSGFWGFPRSNYAKVPMFLPPSGIPLLANTIHLAIGPEGSCAVKTDGSLWCWGMPDGRFVNSECTTSGISIPRRVPCVTNALSVTTPSEGFICVLHRDQSVSCIYDSDPFHGCSFSAIPDTSSTYFPRQWPGAKVIGLPKGIKEIDANWDCACALTEADEVYCWGSGPCQGPATTDGAWTDTAVLVTRLK